MPLVHRMPAAVVNEVQVVAVLDRLVAAARAVLVGVSVERLVTARLALAPMACVRAVNVAIVRVVHVVTMLKGVMTTGCVVQMAVLGVRSVLAGHPIVLLW